jgi:hypothetical protein
MLKIPPPQKVQEKISGILNFKNIYFKFFEERLKHFLLLFRNIQFVEMKILKMK